MHRNRDLSEMVSCDVVPGSEGVMGTGANLGKLM
jgi:hypothetical protein